MKKLNSESMSKIQGGSCVSPAAPHLNDCPGMCHASMIVFMATGHGLGPDGLVCIV